jgi:hypothetical protein
VVRRTEDPVDLEILTHVWFDGGTRAWTDEQVADWLPLVPGAA